VLAKIAVRVEKLLQDIAAIQETLAKVKEDAACAINSQRPNSKP